MATVTIPTNYGWEHIGSDSGRGPTLKVAFFQAVTDLEALDTRQKAIQAKLDVHVGKYNAHLADATAHNSADVTNTDTVLGTGGEVTIGLTQGSTAT